MQEREREIKHVNSEAEEEQNKDFGLRIEESSHLKCLKFSWLSVCLLQFIRCEDYEGI